MCILGVALPDPATPFGRRFPLIVANNRDEYVTRPTLPFHVDPETGVACFTDGAAGGTWLGLNLRTRAFAGLTNSRDRYDGRHGAESRGALVANWLRGVGPAPHELDGAAAQRYDGYNILTCRDLAAVAAGAERLMYSTNRQGTAGDAAEGGIRTAAFARGTQSDSEASPATAVHVVANTHIDNWAEPKSRTLRKLLKNAVAQPPPATAEGVAALLGDALSHRECGDCLPASPTSPPGIEARYAEALHVFDEGVVANGHKHATRTQTVLVVERVPEAAEATAAGDESDGAASLVVHYLVRDVDVESPDAMFGAWSCVRSEPFVASEKV